MEALNIMNIGKIFKKAKRVIKHLLGRVHNRKSRLTDSQKLALVAMQHTNKLVIEAERQSGCTVTMLMYAIWYAYNNPMHTVVILSPYPRDLSQTLRVYIDTLFDGVDILSSISRTQIKFRNGSRIIINHLNENSVRGLSVNLLMVEQFNRISTEKMQTFLACILPCFAVTRGSIVIETEEELNLPGFSKIKMHTLPREQPFC